MKRKMLEVCMIIAKDYLHKHPQPYRHYTFIVQNRRIVEWGINRTGSPMTHFGYANHTKIHSELDAYSKARGIMDKNSFEAVNIRITKTGVIRNSCPCRCCFEFLSGLGCKRIWFTTNLENFSRMDIY